MDQFLSQHFPTQIGEIGQLRQIDREFSQICAEFEEIAAEKERIETAIVAALSGAAEAKELIDLGNTLDGLKVEIQEFVTNSESKDNQPFREGNQQRKETGE
jgi:hypothetical protein